MMRKICLSFVFSDNLFSFSFFLLFEVTVNRTILCRKVDILSMQLREEEGERKKHVKFCVHLLLCCLNLFHELIMQALSLPPSKISWTQREHHTLDNLYSNASARTHKLSFFWLIGWYENFYHSHTQNQTHS